MGPAISVADSVPPTLVSLLKMTGLVDALNGNGPFTVLSPTDAAFANAPEGAVDFLLKPENMDTLKTILLYHVVPGKFMSSDIVAGNVDTLAGKSISVSMGRSGGVVLNGNANVIGYDIEASNGVIHLIDAVLIPDDVLSQMGTQTLP